MAGTSANASLNVTMQGNGLQDGLKKWQKSLGLVRDETGKLFNEQKKWVDGLTKSQIELGLYRDGLDEIRNQHGQLVSGLRDWEIENGRYVDSMGNVYDKQSQLIRLGAKQLEQDRQLAASKQQIAAGVRSIGQPMISLATQMAVLGGVEQKQISNVTALTGTYFSMLGATQQVVGGLVTLRTATQGQTIAQTVLNAVTGNWVTLAAGAVAVGGVAYVMSQTGDEAEMASEKVVLLVDALNKLDKIALTVGGRKNWITSDFGVVAADSIGQSGESDFEKQNRKLEERNKILAKEQDIQNTIFQIEHQRKGTWDNWYNKKFGGVGALDNTDQLKEQAEAYKKYREELDRSIDPNLIASRLDSISNSALSALEKERKELDAIARDIKLAFALAAKTTDTEARKQIEAKARQAQAALSVREQEFDKKDPEAVRLREAEKQYADAYKNAASYMTSSLSNRQKTEKSLNEQLASYSEALNDSTDLTEEQRAVLRQAIDATQRAIAENNTLGDLRREAADRQRKENEERERYQLLYANRNESGMGGMFDEATKKQLGLYDKYFTKAETAQEKFERMSEEIRRKGLETYKSQAEIDEAILNLHKETFPEMKQLAESKGDLSSASGGATYASSEAYKIITGEKDRTAKAVETAARKQVDAANKNGTLVAESIQKGFESLQSTA